MEGMSIDILGERIRNQEARIRSNHDSISKLRDQDRKKGEALVRIEEQLDDQSSDLGDLKKIMTRILWGLFGAIAVGLMFVVAVATLIIQTAS